MVLKLPEKAVVWEKAGSDRHGDPTVHAPVEISCRWEGGSFSAVGADGSPISYTAMIMVNDEVPLNSIIRLGKLEDLPDVPDNLHEVVFRDDIPDIKGRDPQRNLGARRWKKLLPEVVD